MQLSELERLIAGGESETLELKQSTAQLTRAAETLCAFLNANGGLVVFGVTPNGKLVGQHVSDRTQQEIANTLRRFEPPAPITLERQPLSRTTGEVLILEAAPSGEVLPFVYDGRAYERIGTTTSVMPQEKYQQLLLNRAHNRSRWENAPAEGVSLAILGDFCKRISPITW